MDIVAIRPLKDPKANESCKDGIQTKVQWRGYWSSYAWTNLTA